jgi:hypothetical protein
VGPLLNLQKVLLHAIEKKRVISYYKTHNMHQIKIINTSRLSQTLEGRILCGLGLFETSESLLKIYSGLILTQAFTVQKIALALTDPKNSEKSKTYNSLTAIRTPDA